MLVWPVIIFISIYLISLILLYFYQEKLLFVSDVLTKDYKFKFEAFYHEKNLETEDHKILSGLLFKADKSNGVVFFLHGNAGSNNSWGFIHSIYTALNYDLYLLDYRGYGKSEGKIESEKQLYSDVQQAYNMIAKEYGEEKIIIIGQSLGTGPATMLAARNNPKTLILLTPYFSMSHLVRQKFRIVPDFLLKYKFRTDDFIEHVKAPIAIFHGNKDLLINHSASLKLIKLCKPDDQIFIIENLGHNGIHDNQLYHEKIKEVLK